MRVFNGFPARTKSTPIPNLFFSEVLPQIDDVAELKVTLHAMWAVHGKKGYPRFVTSGELSGDGQASGVVQHGLDLAVGRGTLLRLTVERNGTADDLYFVNTEADRRALERIKRGEISVGAPVRNEPHQASLERPNIFALYEQNIGMLSPMIAEELEEAERLYPASWVQDAFREAVELNKRSWRYIARILERWAAEGKDDGEPGRHPEAESDPQEYYRRYGHLLRG
jgi:DnaD/phage-associated family protein